MDSNIFTTHSGGKIFDKEVPRGDVELVSDWENAMPVKPGSATTGAACGGDIGSAFGGTAHPPGGGYT